jgi:hypothetical protein
VAEVIFDDLFHFYIQICKYIFNEFDVVFYVFFCSITCSEIL